MFGLLSFLLTFALVSFGGVLKYTWLAIEIIWIVGIGALLAIDFVRRRAFDPPLIAFFVVSGLIAIFAAPRLAIGLFAGGADNARDVAYRAGVCHIGPGEMAALEAETGRTLYRFDVRDEAE